MRHERADARRSAVAKVGTAGSPRRLANLKVRTKIALVAGVTLLITLAVAAAGLLQAGKLHTDIRALNTRAASLENIAAVRQELGKVILNGVQARTANADAQHELQIRQDAAIERVDALFWDYVGQVDEDVQWRGLVDNFKVFWQSFRDMSKVLQTADHDSSDYSRAWNGYTPAVERVDLAVTDLAEYEGNAAAEMAARSSATYNQAVWTIVSVLFAGLLVALFLTQLVARAIVRPLAEVQQVLHAVAAGDLTQRARVRGRDELGMMAESVNAANDSMRVSLLEVRSAQEELVHQASHDSLTGLANRSLFEERSRQALARNDQISVVLVDLDDFKGVNDQLGHPVGDRLLAAVAQRLRSGVRGDDLVARLGGDEFALLLIDTSESDAHQILTRLEQAFEAPVRAGEHDLLVRCSAGLAESWPGADPAELLRRADVAMYAAKDQGKGRGTRYEASLDLKADNDALLGAELRHGLDRDEFYMLFQPIVALPDGNTVGAEALVRWRHPSGRDVPPDQFVVVAERTGLIGALGGWILRAVCRQAMQWLQRHGPDCRWTVSVNISARQLREPGFAAEVTRVLTETGLPADRLVMEVTETAAFDNGPAVAALLEIKALGVKISLDDFGTGHSSLGLLRTCPVDVLKLDKSFVDGITGGAGEAVIAVAVIQIANGLGLAAIAEGVETPEQAARLHELGYRMAQGFHFARPMPSEQVGPLLAGISPEPVLSAG